MQELGEIHESGFDANGHFFQRVIPFYSCGHCSKTIALDYRRTRERITCKGCSRWICEKSEICRKHCTPLYSLAKDHFENAGRHGALVPAIMSGETSLEGAAKKGLILTDL